MPKLKSRPPKLGKDNGYAVVYVGGEKKPLGCKFGTEEADKAYKRFIAEWATIGDIAITNKTRTYLIDELAVAFLRWAKSVYHKESCDAFAYREKLASFILCSWNA